MPGTFSRSRTLHLMSTLATPCGSLGSEHDQLISAADLSPLPAIEVVKCLHGGEGAAVTFHRKLDGQWQDLGAIMGSELRTRWLAMAEHLAIDAYFSINSTYEQKRSTSISEITGLAIYSRK